MNLGRKMFKSKKNHLDKTAICAVQLRTVTQGRLSAVYLRQSSFTIFRIERARPPGQRYAMPSIPGSAWIRIAGESLSRSENGQLEELDRYTQDNFTTTKEAKSSRPCIPTPSIMQNPKSAHENQSSLPNQKNLNVQNLKFDDENQMLDSPNQDQK
jgi:hypothetical protein